MIKQIIAYLERRAWLQAEERKRALIEQKKRELREAQEQYAALKAEKEAMELAAKEMEGYFFFNGNTYSRVCGQLAKFEERVEQLMRDQ